MPNQKNPAAENEPVILTTATELGKVVSDAVQEATAELTEQIKTLAEQTQATIEATDLPVTEEPIITTPTELEKVVGDAVQEATAELTEQIKNLTEQSQTVIEPTNPQIIEEPIVTTPAELEKVVGDAVQEATAVLADKVTELTEQVQAVTEAVNPPVIEETPTAVEATILATKQVAKEVAEQVAEAKTEIATQITEQVAAATEGVRQQVEVVLATAKDREIKKVEENSLVVSIIGHLALLASPSKTAAYVISSLAIVFAIGMLVFSGLYLTELSVSEQGAYESARIAAEDAETIKQLAMDVVHIHLLKNENMELAIQKKMDALRQEGLPDFQAVPMAYIDGGVIKDVVADLPDSVRKLSYAEDLVTTELKKVADYAEKELNKH